MRKIFFVVLCLCVWDTAVYADFCNEQYPDGCDEGWYCAQVGPVATAWQCQRCNDSPVSNSNYAWPYSDKGGGQEEGAKVCYQKCDDTYSDFFPDPVEHGRWEAIDNRAYYQKQCQYKLQCDKPEDQCYGFHAVSDDGGGTWQCKKNAEERLLDGPSTCEWYLVTYDSTSGEWSSQGVVGCHSSCKTVHFEPNGNMKCSQPVGACVSNEAKCVDRLENCGGTSGTIDGEAHWNSDSGGWDYSDCTCTTTDAVVENGTGRKICGWSEGEKDSTVWSSDCVVEVAKCNVGHCVQGADRSKCVPAPLGYYGAGDTVVCQACPDVGTTTERVGATSAGACVMVRGVGGTRFRDSQGCFYLPGTGFIQKAN